MAGVCFATKSQRQRFSLTLIFFYRFNLILTGKGLVPFGNIIGETIKCSGRKRAHIRLPHLALFNLTREAIQQSLGLLAGKGGGRPPDNPNLRLGSSSLRLLGLLGLLGLQ